MWFFLGVLLGSTVISQHPDMESCMGRKAVLAQRGTEGVCVAIVLPALAAQPKPPDDFPGWPFEIKQLPHR